MKTLRSIFVAALLLFSLQSGWARGGPEWLRYGFEWGYSAQFYTAGTYTFLSPNRLLIHDNYYGFIYHSGGLFTVRTGVDFCKKWNASLNASVVGISPRNTAIPFSGRLTLYPNGFATDGMQLFADVGVALKPETGAKDGTFIAKCGGGYRYHLSKETSLDFLCSLQGVIEGPHVLYDSYYGRIPENDILRNLAGFLALNFSIALNF